MIWAPKTSKEYHHQKWIRFSTVSSRFRVMSNSLKWHHYEVVEIELFLFFQLSPWVSISFIIPMKISKLGGLCKTIFWSKNVMSAAKVQKTHDLQKFTSFNYIPSRFQNIYNLISNITILWCCGNNNMKSMFWEKNAKFGEFFFSFSTVPRNTNRNLENRAELPKQCFCHKIRFELRKLQKNGTFRTGLHLCLS